MVINSKISSYNMVINSKISSYFENEFKIICISDCKSIANNQLEIKKGETFITNEAEFNYSTGNDTNSCFNFNIKEDLIRLSINNIIIGLFKKINFMKIEDWRNNAIEDIMRTN